MSDRKFNALKISHSAEKAEKHLSAILKATSLQEHCYAYKSRVKSWSDLLKKVEKKKKKKSDYELSSITDVLGLRIVTLFRQDMINIIDIILSLIAHKLKYNPIPFQKDSLIEAIIYSPDNTNDTVISQAKQKIESFGLVGKVKLELSVARYSSIHLVARMDMNVPDFQEHYYIPIEVQIRTVFEDAWGELDHKYGYQSREEKTDKKITNPHHVVKNLLTMKKFVDACSEYADNIRDLATESKMRESRTAKQLDTDDLIARNLHSVGVSEQVILEYMKVREIRATAETTEGGSLIYLRAAESFSKLLGQTLSNNLIVESNSYRVYYYYLKMDEALCRLSTSEQVEIEKALTIYKDLVKAYPAYPVIRYRMGQTLIRLMRYEEARNELKKCRTNVARLSPFPESKRVIKLPDIELNRISIGLYILLGYAYWKEALDIYIVSPKSNKIISFLEQAFIQTEPALSLDGLSKKNRIKLINNLMSYALEIVYLKKIKTKRDYSLFINEHLVELEQSIDVNNSTAASNLDTLMNCYDFLNRDDEAKKIARRLEKISLEANIEGNSIDSSVLKRVSSILDKNV